MGGRRCGSLHIVTSLSLRSEVGHSRNGNQDSVGRQEECIWRLRQYSPSYHLGTDLNLLFVVEMSQYQTTFLWI